jgi:hypothetical protein
MHASKLALRVQLASVGNCADALPAISNPRLNNEHFSAVFHYQFRVWDGLSFLLFIAQDKSRAGLFELLYYNINNN